MKTIKTITKTALLIILFVGCTKNVRSHNHIVGDERVKVTIIDSELLDKITIISSRQIPLANHLIKAQVDINSTTEEAYSFDYKFLWYDNKGFVVGTSIWKPFFIQGKTLNKISHIAPHKSAKKFECRLKLTN